jgi:hypothetical protein
MTKKINDKYLSNAKESIRQYEKTLYYNENQRHFCSSISCDDCIQYTTNQKAHFATDAMIEASMDSIALNFNLDSMLDNLLSGISIPGMEEEVVEKATKTTKIK